MSEPDLASLEARITAALVDGDEVLAARLLRVAFGAEAPDGEGQSSEDLGDLLEELAEYYAEEGRYEDAVAVMGRALAAGWQGDVDGRCRIAEFLLRGGLMNEAEELYLEVREDHRDDPWLYHGVGTDHQDVGEHERALAWFAAGISHAVEGQDRAALDALVAGRRGSLEALGHAPSEVDRDAEAARAALGAAAPHPLSRDDVLPAPVGLAFPWFPGGEYERAVDRWPSFAKQWGSGAYADYCRRVEGDLRAFAAVAPQRRLWLAPLHVDEYARWSAESDLDPEEAVTQRRYAAEQLRRGEVVAWPPDPGGACWCGSGDAYATCCPAER